MHAFTAGVCTVGSVWEERGVCTVGSAWEERGESYNTHTQHMILVEHGRI